MGAYDEFLRGKAIKAPLSGMDKAPELSGHLFPHQADVVDMQKTHHTRLSHGKRL